MRRDEALERRVDCVKMNIGDEAVDAGVDAGRRRPVHVAVCRYEPRQHGEIGEPARISSLGLVAADAGMIVALEIELLSFGQAPRP